MTARRGRRLAGPALLALGLALSPASAEEIGEVARIVPKVIAYPPPARRLVELQRKDPIERGTGIRLENEGSYLLVAFNLDAGLGGRILSGQDTTWVAGTATLAGKAEATFGDPIQIDSRQLLLASGQLGLNLLPGRGPLAVRTPHARIDLRGTSLRILTLPAVGTFVAVDEGTVEVQAEEGERPIGAPITLTAGQWAWVPPGGIPGQPDPAAGAAGAAGVVGNGGGVLRPFGGLDDPPGLPTEPPFTGCCQGGQPPGL